MLSLAKRLIWCEFNDINLVMFHLLRCCSDRFSASCALVVISFWRIWFCANSS